MKKVLLVSLLVSCAQPFTSAQEVDVAGNDRLETRLYAVATEHQGAIPAKELLELWKEFPAAQTLQMLMDLRITDTTDSELRGKMLIALRDTPGVSEDHRAFATRILAGELQPLSTRLGHKLSLKFKALDGREVDLAKLRGKVTLIDFWATWCGPCVASLPELKRIYEECHSRGLEIIGISYDFDRARLEDFVRNANVTWPQYFDGASWDNQIGREFAIRILPTMGLIDKNGILRSITTSDKVRTEIEKLLSE
ncbi:MAG TPA: TlpA disulfide reductase family protein [Candidatus Udaeobacter sp.]|nr:TlpA disulfide reductase family protein [Candidatus Udaeobacter sp.]